MKSPTINMLKKYLNNKQLMSYLTAAELYFIYLRDKTDENLKAYKAEFENFLLLTDGKHINKIVPPAAWAKS